MVIPNLIKASPLEARVRKVAEVWSCIVPS